MKKILLIIAGLIIATTTYATTMCTATDSVGIVLDPNITMKGFSSNTNTWWVWSDSWTVYGVGACLNSNRSKGMGGTVAHLHDTDNDGKDRLVTGGDRYGRYCWCRLTHPVSSLWTFYYDFGAPSSCASQCTNRCGYRAYADVAFCAGMINSIQPD